MAAEIALPKKAYKDVQIYCVKCRVKHDANNPVITKNVKGNFVIKDVCKKTGTNMQVFTSRVKVEAWSK